ncbi:IPT/TIG domain-containing protein [Pedobacter sp. MC2016-24]|uniref:IPT/TIG domain-containing protein n=1 Tax=Pedobacter sp. MC2016-24 TaxID=2780090 RepID=UPI00187E4608|nr:IPT/TIG domain-containing protein [Pedobacter sp. MC2016-24]MBE9602665.1 IPT/TIG domain-containing protein [Pedobacter sp. MC2016-24]
MRAIKLILGILLLTAAISCSKKNVPTPEPVPPIIPVNPVSLTITSFAPLTALVGQQIVITGTGFGTDLNAVKVQFADGDAISPKTVTATEITVEVPASGKTGLVTVTLNGKSVKSTGIFTLSVPEPVKPTVTGFSPTTAKSGEIVTITGTGFGTDINKVDVLFTNGELITPKTVSNTQITFEVPIKASTGQLIVYINGTGITTETFTFSNSTGGGTAQYTTTNYEIVADGGYIIWRPASSEILRTEFSHADGGGIKTSNGGTVSLAIGGLEKTKSTVIDYYINFVPTDQSALPYVTYTDKDDAAKTIKVYKVFFRERFSLQFPQNAPVPTPELFTPKYVMDNIRSTEQKILIVQVW